MKKVLASYVYDIQYIKDSSIRLSDFSILQNIETKAYSIDETTITGGSWGRPVKYYYAELSVKDFEYKWKIDIGKLLLDLN